MPLALRNTIESERPKEFIWDPSNKEEDEEMKLRISSFIAKGYFVSSRSSSGSTVLLPPKQSDSHFVFRVLSKNGDDRLVWNRNSLEQIEEAKQKFNTYIKNGYKAFAVKRDGNSRGMLLDSFDMLLEEVILAKGKDALLVPRTVPG